MFSRYRHDKQGNSNIIVIPCSISSSLPTISTIFSQFCISSVSNFPRFLASDKGNNVNRLPQPSTSTSCKLEKLTISSIFSFHTNFKFDKSFNISFFKPKIIPFVSTSISSVSNITSTSLELCTFNSFRFFK
ncbi:hypothetical protein V8G54_021130 [Vigna mungo]|uniref:Uncharacterized protein n=1 Tax=Vigna mungo TaxID=3915 RepID=A0AAQ3ND02_VIGMU